MKKAVSFILSFIICFSCLGVVVSAEAEVKELTLTLPESVDNSTSPYFPEIGNQGSMGSCTSWAHVYYSFTYAMNKLRGIKTTPENTYSPQWSYNLTSNGEGEGSTAADIEWFLEKQGAVPLSMVPYEEDPVTWCADEKVWRESINNRLLDTIKYKSFGYEKSQITSADDSDLTDVKTALAQGELLTFSTAIYSWITTKLTSHKDVSENDKFLGEEAVIAQHGYKGGHAMTIVGYNDNLWVDINANSKVDSGEMGAFKIANSWGEDYANGGFIWMAYDALNEYSCVGGVENVSNREMAMSSIEGVIARPYGEGTDVYIKYNFKTDNRRANHIIITAEKDGTASTYKAFFPLLTLTSGEAKIPYDGNMLISLDNVIPDISEKNFKDYTWSVTFVDKYEDDCSTTYRNAEIVIESTGEVFRPANTFPITLNGGEKTVEFSQTDLNHAVVYYRGYSNPTINYQINGENWINSKPMESNTEREGYVNKFVIDLKDKASARVYFTNPQGKRDDNEGGFFTVTKGLNYVVTEGVAEPLNIDIVFDAEAIERTMSHQYSANVTGGYAPYKYTYVFKNLETGEESTLGGKEKDQSVFKIFNETGSYSVTVLVEDFEGTKASKEAFFQVQDSPFEFAEFKVTNEGELFFGKAVNFSAVTRFENIQRFGIGKERYDLVITKNGKVCYTAVLDPLTVDHNKMTSTIAFSWTPDGAGVYRVTISGTDYGKDYAEKTIEIQVVNKAVIYYKGFSNPYLYYQIADGSFQKKEMNQSREETGYINKAELDLGYAEDTKIYFGDGKGRADDNGGEYYTVKAGKSFFTTKNAEEVLKASLNSDILNAEINTPLTLKAEVVGGYTPYTYKYTVENKATGEKLSSENQQDLSEFLCTLKTEGEYNAQVVVTDFSGAQAQADLKLVITAPTEATTSAPVEISSTATFDEVTVPTEPTIPASTADEPAFTEETTAAEVTHPTEIIEEFVGYIGDTNSDLKVSIKDATLVQKKIANIPVDVEILEEIADCNEDSKVNIKDATLIQKHLAKLPALRVGESIYRYITITLPIPTTVTSQASEDEATQNTTHITTQTIITTIPVESSVPQTSSTVWTDPTEEATTEPVITEATEPVTTELTTTEKTEVTTEEITTTQIATEEPTTEEITTEEITTSPVTQPELREVTFTNSFKWSGTIYCYYWSDSDITMTAWPGAPMQSIGLNDFGESLYNLQIPQNAQYIIFTNGTNQTVDIQYSGGVCRYYPLPAVNDKGHHLVERW